jgi:ParB/RepB/Spo0J family partition protein
MLNLIDFLVSKIIPYEKNNKKHSPEQIEKLAKQIADVGYLVPIVIDENNVILSGHCRWLAIKSLGWKTVPVIIKDDLSEAQKIAWRIADNKVAESEWELEFLKFELGTLQRLGVDLTKTAFDLHEVDKILSSVNFEPADLDQQGKLDEKKPLIVNCPSCGHEFNAHES